MLLRPKSSALPFLAAALLVSTGSSVQGQLDKPTHTEKVIALGHAAEGVQASIERPGIEDAKDTPFVGTIHIDVDATDVQHHIFSVREMIPVGGKRNITLLFPQWNPGDHTPNGSLDKLAGLVTSAGGQRLRWVRDPVSVFAFHVELPQGVKSLEVSYQYLGSTGTGTGPVLITRNMLDLQWQSVILYPAGYYSRDIQFAPEVHLPLGWVSFSALDGASREGDILRFAPVSLETLVDSPIMAGRFGKQVILSNRPVPVMLDVVADNEAGLARVAEAAEAFKPLQEETTRMFRSYHYNHYDHMLWLSDELGPVYYEHHRSGENSRPASFFSGSGSLPSLSFLEHGYVHSWNGMYRRPAEMTPPDLNTPERDSLFWVFEGLTEYWSDVLAARSGITSRADTIQNFATLAAYASIDEGARWRTLQDVNNMPVFAFRKASSWPSWQRDMFDAYSQGELLWLAVDVKMRQLSRGKVSLDDFARTFFAGHDGSDQNSTYTFKQMTAALNSLCPFDWQSYLNNRLNEYGTALSLEGIAAGGYTLNYTSKATAPEDAQRLLDLAFSIGMQVSAGGRITAVHWNGPAFQAGLIPGGTLVSVNGQTYSPQLLESAVSLAQEGKPILVQVRRFGDTADYTIRYTGGLRQPQLVPTGTSEPLLDRILSSRRDLN